MIAILHMVIDIVFFTAMTYLFSARMDEIEDWQEEIEDQQEMLEERLIDVENYIAEQRGESG